MRSHIFKKSKIGNELGIKPALYETYGKKSQEIIVSEDQLNKLLERCGGTHNNEQLTPPWNSAVEDSEDLTIAMLDEVDDDELELDEIFDDYEDIDHSQRGDFGGRKSKVVGVYRDDSDQEQNFEEHFDYEEGEFSPGAGADDESYKGHHFKQDVIGAYDPDFSKLSREDEIYEDSEGQETYDYGQDEGADEWRLKHGDLSRSHARALKKDMGYDEKHEYRGERGTHFYESVEDLMWKRDLDRANFLVVETYESIRKTILRERVRELDRRDFILPQGVLTEQWNEPGSPVSVGSSAASGIENIIDNIKKAYTFLKDSKTRKQIENTLVKLDNFMSYTAELIGSGRDQRGSKSYSQVARPIPHPEVYEPEELEDIDDEITIS